MKALKVRFTYIDVIDISDYDKLVEQYGAVFQFTKLAQVGELVTVKAVAVCKVGLKFLALRKFAKKYKEKCKMEYYR